MNRYITALLIYSVFSVSMPTGLFCSDRDDCTNIREMSSKRNERLFNKIAIGLLNGKTRFIPLDNMIKVIRDYKILEFDSKEAGSLEDIIAREIAFRMLKQHYLPRAGDKIRVYRIQQGFQQEAGVYPQRINGYNVNISLPITTATIKDRNRLKTIYWNDLVAQITSGIQRLWFNRIGSISDESSKIDNIDERLEAVDILRKKFAQQEEISVTTSDAWLIVHAVEDKLNRWAKEDAVSREDFSILSELFAQYIMLSLSMETPEIAKEINGLSDISSLRDSLLSKIQKATDAINSANPDDYAALAMLQSLLSEISQNFRQLSTIPKKHLLDIKIETQNPSHSA